MSKRVAIAEARASLKDLVHEVKNRKERIKLTRYDRTIAGLVPDSDLKLLEDCEDALEDCKEQKDQHAHASGAGAAKKPARKRPRTSKRRRR